MAFHRLSGAQQLTLTANALEEFCGDIFAHAKAKCDSDIAAEEVCQRVFACAFRERRFMIGSRDILDWLLRVTDYYCKELRHDKEGTGQDKTRRHQAMDMRLLRKEASRAAASNVPGLEPHAAPRNSESAVSTLMDSDFSILVRMHQRILAALAQMQAEQQQRGPKWTWWAISAAFIFGSLCIYAGAASLHLPLYRAAALLITVFAHLPGRLL